MQIHQLKTNKRKSLKRVGRGGKRGTYSGRGMKGQKARSGGNVDPLFEGGRSSLVARMKKKRGFTSIHAKKNAVTLATLEKHFADGDTVAPAQFVAKNMINKKNIKNGVKIVATGTLSKKLTLSKDILCTVNAKDAIEKAGGMCEETKEKANKK